MKNQYINPNHNKDCSYQAYPLPGYCTCRQWDFSHLTDIDLCKLNKELSNSRERTNMEFRVSILEELGKRQKKRNNGVLGK